MTSHSQSTKFRSSVIRKVSVDYSLLARLSKWCVRSVTSWMVLLIHHRSQNASQLRMRSRDITINADVKVSSWRKVLAQITNETNMTSGVMFTRECVLGTMLCNVCSSYAFEMNDVINNMPLTVLHSVVFGARSLAGRFVYSTIFVTCAPLG